MAFPVHLRALPARVQRLERRAELGQPAGVAERVIGQLPRPLVVRVGIARHSVRPRNTVLAEDRHRHTRSMMVPAPMPEATQSVA